ncbi:ATP-dependent DNA helicase PIF1-like [Panicum virgatum]|uniref:ATP-dependent DNA helicase PIF1-like n=1 Tax=Panicum virgatum TaxID=38727 RepID=UPI0019D6153F|nr:ATP-dependent DNA helicase PIF1-like [Panicum virgatum]
MSEDYRRNDPSDAIVEQMVLIDIRNMLQSRGKDIKSFPLPEIDNNYDDACGVPREIFEESNIKSTEDDVYLSESLNNEQRAAYDEILSSIDSNNGGLFFVGAAYDEILSSIDSNNGGLFFVDGPCGTGKTFLYRALLAKVHSQNKIVVATATSRVAASIMPGGRTAHSRFKIPLTIDSGGYCSFTKQSGTTTLLRTACLIVWDEVSMIKKQAVEALDNSMRDIMDRPDLPFGGKTIVFGGDYRQVLLVIRKGSRAQIVDDLLCRSYLWDYMRHLKLVRNMRAHSDPWFAEYLLRIGNGIVEANVDGEVRLPDEICVPYTGDGNENMADKDYITSRAILSTRSDWVDRINMKMIGSFQGGEVEYHSFDSVVDDPHNYYPSEFLNTLAPNGLPPHVLKLKVGCPIILLRNIDPANGLCNGTSFVMTVNKSQGQTIPNFGVYLPDPVFSHGQLYVAMSRATTRTNIKILALPPNATELEEEAKKEKKNAKNKGKETVNNKKEKKKIPVYTFTKNIVYKEIFVS